MRQKGFHILPIIIISLLIMTLLFITIKNGLSKNIFLTPTSTSPSPLPPNIISDWKLYKDNKNNITFKYPNELKYFTDEKNFVNFYEEDKNKVIFSYYRFEKIPVSEFDFTTIDPLKVVDNKGRSWITSFLTISNFDYSAVYKNGETYYIVNFSGPLDSNKSKGDMRLYLDKIISTIDF